MECSRTSVHNQIFRKVAHLQKQQVEKASFELTIVVVRDDSPPFGFPYSLNYRLREVNKFEVCMETISEKFLNYRAHAIVFVFLMLFTMARFHLKGA